MDNREYEELLGVDTDGEESEFGYCENCGEGLRPNELCIGIECPDGAKILLCEDCLSKMTFEEMLSIIGVAFDSGEAEDIAKDYID